MRIRTKYQLMTAGLITAVVFSISAAVIFTQESVLRAQAMKRLDALAEGAARIAKESADNHDPLMAISYLKFLMAEHGELAFAAVAQSGRVSKLGEERGDLVYLERSAVPGAGPVRYTISAYPSSAGASAGALHVSTGGVSLSVSGRATVSVEEPPGGEAVSVRLGFVKQTIDAEISGALDALMLWTFCIAGGFMFLGLLANAWITRLLTGPIEVLAQATGLLAAGRLNVVVPVRGRDEMGTLTKSFNSMAAKLKEFSESREDILHALTHEINTPLNGIKGYLELWQDGKLPQAKEQTAETVNTMMAAVLRMENSLSGALSLFKLENRRPAPGSETLVRVEELFAQTVAIFSPLALAKSVKLFPPPPEARGALLANEDLVRRIISNLVSNAIKYAQEGGYVRMGLSETADTLTLRVSNTGRGIPPADLPHLFTKFYRSEEDRSSGRRIPGSGLGLYIVKKAVDSLGGRIVVDSRQNVNTLFLVTLPKKSGADTVTRSSL